MTLTRAVFLLAFANTSCGYSFPDPPKSIPHEVEEGGAMHAERLEDPFLCGGDINDLEVGVPCTDTRPAPDALLSCDTAGCHGNFAFTPSTAVNRELWGGEGPSCYTCHGNKWDDD